MGLIRALPLPVRLPLIRGGLAAVRAARTRDWPSATLEGLQPGPLLVTGFLDEVLGIGAAGRATIEALTAAGHAVIPHQLRPAMKRVWSPGAMPALPAAPGGVWLIHANAPETEIALMAHDPADWVGRYRIGYWAWETTEAPSSWARTARWLHEVWVPSRFVADAMARAFDRIGAPEEKAKLRVMPHPVSAPAGITPAPERFNLDPAKQHALVMFDGRSAFARKNPWGAIEAWTRAFPEPAANAQLLVKAVSLSADRRAGKKLKALAARRPDIVLFEEQLTALELWSLLASVEVILSPYRSEGFGLVQAEAMAMARPVIATGWSAPAEFIDDQSGVLLPYRLIPVRDPTGAYNRGQWAEPDIDACARALRDLLDNPAKARALGEAAPARIARLSEPWTRDNLARLPMAAFLAKSARSPAP